MCRLCQKLENTVMSKTVHMATFEYDSMYLVVVFIVAPFQMLLLLQKSTSNQDDLEVLIIVSAQKIIGS